MEAKIVEIEITDKFEKISTIIQVEQLSNNVFRTIDNVIIDHRLTFGTEFETRLNNELKHEIIKITKVSNFITKRFNLTSQFNESEYKLLGDEIIKHGGFWQVDFGSIVTINLPKNNKLNLDEIFNTYGFKTQ